MDVKNTDIARESVMCTDNDDDSEIMRSRKASTDNDEKYPDAFIHAVRQNTVKRFLTDSTSTYSSRTCSVSSSNDSKNTSYSSKGLNIREQLTMIPESVIAALTNIQRSQLRRVREEASNHLEDILRNVVKTVDMFYADQLNQEIVIPARKMIGNDENDEETRIREEIAKILKGDIDDKRACMCQGNKKVVEKRKMSMGKESENEEGEDEEEEDDEQTDVTTAVNEEVEEPVCQVMMNIIEGLNEISTDRQAILNEVLEWMDKCIAEPYSELPELAEEEYKDVDQEKLFKDWEVTKNVRRLTLISEELGLAKFDNIDEESKQETAEKEKGDDRRKFLEEKMNKQKSRYIATKVYDAELLTEPKNWKSAFNAIMQVLEEVSCTSSNQRSKQMFGNAHKQFRFMTELAERQQEEKIKLDLQLNNVTGKLNKEEKEVKSLKKKKQALESQLEKFQDDMVELKKEVEVRDDIIKERAEQIYELEYINEELEKTLVEERELSKKRQPPPIIQKVIQQAPLPSPPQQQPQQPQQPQQQATTQQPPVTNTATNKEEIKAEKQQTVSQPPKQKSTRKATKDAGIKVKKENREDEKRKKQEEEKEKARRTSVVMSLKEAKAELEEIRKAGEARENLLKELKIKLETETGRFEQEKSKLAEEIQFHKQQTEAAKQLLEFEKETWERIKNEMLQEKDRLTNEVQAKEEIINFQEQRIREVAREMTLSLMRAGLQANTTTTRGGNATDKLLESKQLLAKLHLQYDYEMQMLRTYMKREIERHQAENRRLETEYKANLNNIYRDTSVIFRAVNRFKECLAVLFDRENLPDTAHDIRNFPNLFEDETATDPQIKLLKMAGAITELMVQMEFKMSQALINKRMEIKDNSLAKNFLTKDLEAREELLKKAKELGNLQAEKLKQAREQLSSQEIKLLKFKHSESDKYVDMMERNKELTRQNQILNRELTYLQKELQEETAKKENEKQEMEKTNKEMKMKIEQQAAIVASLKAENAKILSQQKLHLKNSDMMRNIKLLNDALATKKLSEEKHTVAMTVVEKTMDVTGARLACLVRKYVLHKQWRKICDGMKEHHKNNKRPRKVERYLKKIEERIAKEKKKLSERKAEILQQKTEMHLHFKQICNELNKEHGVHLIRPTVKKVYSNLSVQQIQDQDYHIYKKRQDHLKKMLHRASGDYGGSLDGVTGFKFIAPPLTDRAEWQLPRIETTQSSIVTPKILDIEMRKARQSSQRVLTSRSCGSFDNRTNPWQRRQKIRESSFSLPPIATLYPES